MNSYLIASSKIFTSINVEGGELKSGSVTTQGHVKFECNLDELIVFKEKRNVYQGKL